MCTAVRVRQAILRVEPVDVWGGFRAGRKSQPRSRECGQSSNDLCSHLVM